MKKILLSLMTLVLVIGLVGAGAFAYFSDTEQSTGNTFTAGTLDIGLDHSILQGNKGGVSDTWKWEALVLEPGATLEGTLYVWNGGSLTADVMSITVDYGLITGGTPATVSDPKLSVLDEEIRIQTATWGGNPITKSGGAPLLDGKTLAELRTLGEVQMYVGGVAVTLAPDEQMALFIIWECDPNADNGIQGDSVDITVTIKAEQE